jgi:hypothetical protein
MVGGLSALIMVGAYNAGPGAGAGPEPRWWTLGSAGGGVNSSSTNYRLDSTVGHSGVIGVSTNASNVVEQGFWYGTSDRDDDGLVELADNCPNNANPGQENFDSDEAGDLCDAEDDGDGYTDLAESGAPVCADTVNDDNFDDGSVNDGCPAQGVPEGACGGSADDDGDGFPNDGCAQVGSIAEGAFNIGTTTLGRCNAGIGPDPSSSWPSDFVSAGTPDSTDKVTITDLTSFLAPARRLDTSPGDLDFSSRWDLIPGRGTFLDWIAINDLTALLAGDPGFPDMFGGARAFDGPICTGP